MSLAFCWGARATIRPEPSRSCGLPTAKPKLEPQEGQTIELVLLLVVKAFGFYDLARGIQHDFTRAIVGRCDDHFIAD